MSRPNPAATESIQKSSRRSSFETSLAPIQVNVYRGSEIESRHLVDAVLLNAQGATVATFGDPQTKIFTRSVIKPLQAIPFLLSEAYQTAPDPARAVSIACASHDAQSIHTQVITEWLAQMKLSGENLHCGPQRPADGSTPQRIHHNCSGKHSAMLATCLRKGWDISTYFEWSHPLQKEIRNWISQLADVDMEHASWGIDGCGLPTYSMSIASIAKAMSRFLEPARLESRELQAAMKIAHDAWTQEPWMISGHGSLDSETLAATKGRVFVKVGAEGGYVALMYDQGIALALKSRDGALRACEAALFLLLERFANIDPSVLAALRPFALRNIRNAAGETVGRVEPIFT